MLNVQLKCKTYTQTLKLNVKPKTLKPKIHSMNLDTYGGNI